MLSTQASMAIAVFVLLLIVFIVIGLLYYPSSCTKSEGDCHKSPPSKGKDKDKHQEHHPNTPLTNSLKWNTWDGIRRNAGGEKQHHDREDDN